MRGIVLERPGEFRQVSLPDAGKPPPGQARVRVRRVGICGTDWHAFHGRQPFFSYPRVLGHELGVEVEEINDPDSALRPGDRCSVEPYLNCESCSACVRGKGNCCENLRVLGVHCDGGMCERLIVPVRKLHPSAGLSLDQLALVETLGIGCHAVARAGVEAGEHVLILGAGPIGLSAIPFIQAVGARAIIADVSPQRLAFAREKMQASHTLDAREDLSGRLRDCLDGQWPTVILDATGNQQSMMKTFDLVAHGGRIVFVGLFQGEVAFNDPNFHRRECSLHASRNALPGDFTRIIQLIEQGAVDTTPWITHRAPARAFVDQLPGWLTPDAGLLKAMIEF